MNIPKGEFDGNAPVSFGKSGNDDQTKSAFSEFAENIAEVTQPTESSAETETKESKPARQGDNTDEEDKPIPYSRFQKTNRKLARALEELEDLKAQRPPETQRFRETIKETVKDTTDLPEFWRKLYGDNDASKEGYRV